jgi:hypothetical protein
MDRVDFAEKDPQVGCSHGRIGMNFDKRVGAKFPELRDHAVL